MPSLIKKVGDPTERGTEAIEIKMEVFSIGRQKECDCVLNHPGVSRVHALVRLERGKATLCDKTSRNGTYLNNIRLFSEMELLDGDLIQICDTFLVYREELPPVASH